MEAKSLTLIFVGMEQGLVEIGELPGPGIELPIIVTYYISFGESPVIKISVVFSWVNVNSCCFSLSPRRCFLYVTSTPSIHLSLGRLIENCMELYVLELLVIFGGS